MRLSASSWSFWRVSMFPTLFPWTSIVKPSMSPISYFCYFANLRLKNEVQKSERKVTKLHLFFGFIKNYLKLDGNFWLWTKAFLWCYLSKHLMDSWTSYWSGQITTVFAYLVVLGTVWDKHAVRSLWWIYHWLKSQLQALALTCF